MKNNPKESQVINVTPAYYDTRANKWSVTVREGDFVTVHRFHADQDKAEAFSTSERKRLGIDG